MLIDLCQTPGHSARRLQLRSAQGHWPCASRDSCIKSLILKFTLALTVAFSLLDLHFEFPVSTSLFLSVTVPRTRRQLNHPQNAFHISMAQNNGTSSGQCSRQVRRFLQMMCLYTDANLAVSARKWPCKICLRESFDRRQDLDRHIQQMHLPCCVYCPYSPCEWRGCRVDDLQKHLDRQKCNQNSTEQEYRIYDAKMIVDMIREAESNDSIRNAQNWAVRFVRERATELRKHGWLMDPWGCPEQRERRERRISRR
ncbi:hypothetical protein F5888DRAFT_629147 [Russula emetica]|nr:hypothetical protein F5888DRAFT_629147 [Russula emetica]